MPQAPAWSLACPDWEFRIRSGLSLIPSLPLNQQAANKAVAIFDRLQLADVPGTPAMATACGPWFRDIVRNLFGSLDPVTGHRHIREVFTLVPKKSSKTSYSALLMLTALLMNERPRGKFLLVAPTQLITEIAWSQIAGAIALDPFLSDILWVRDHKKLIEHTGNSNNIPSQKKYGLIQGTGATLEVMSFEPGVLTGQKAAGILMDELHVTANMSKASSAIGQLRGGLISQPEGFMFFITTQSEKTPAGVYLRELTRAREVRDGKRPGALLPVLYEFPRAIAEDKDAWKDPAVWPMVMPNLGRSITLDRLVDEHNDALRSGDEEYRRWCSQHLNIEIGLALGSDSWAGGEFWLNEHLIDERLADLEVLLRRSEVVAVGADGGGLDDLFGLAVLGRERGTGNWLLWSHAWAHKIVLTRRKEIAPKLRDLEAAGCLTLVDLPGQDVQHVAEIIMDIERRGLLSQVGVDPWGINALVSALTGPDYGMDIERISAIAQGWKLVGAIKTTERKLAGGELIHSGSPLMIWAVENAKVEVKGNNISITKQVSGTAKIDPLVALFNAVAVMSQNPEAVGGESAFALV